jgi:CBS domain-containing protein
MATPQTDIKSQTIELATTAFEAFCDDISSMFEVDMKCTQKGVCTETTKGLSQKFKKLAAINFIKSEGILNGTFHVIFDQGGLFTLAGIIVMLPKQRILDDRKRGSIKEAEGMADAIKEAGNLLVGAWDRIFREELEGHGHFTQTNTFIGNPWDNPKEKIGLNEEEFSFIPYEMTIGDYPAFNCGVIFPEAIFKTPAPAAETPAPAKEKVAEKPQEEAKTSESESPAAKEEAKVEVAPTAVSEQTKPADGKEPAAGPVSETIQKMVQSSAGLSSRTDQISLAVCAKDIMQKEVLWGNADDSVQQALTKMEQAGVGYMIVGKDGLLDGIVSTFDIAATLSVYLKPMFAKWRRPIDDATLQIRIKWIMTRPVRTIKPDTSLTAIMENMCQSGLRSLPVVEKDGKVVGLVTVFDIFKALLNTESGISTAGKTPQAPSLA